MTQIEALTLLGVEFDADEREIRTAWRQLAKTHHPDRGGSAQFFIMLMEAYQLLMGSGGHTPNPGIQKLTGWVSHSHRRVREPVSAWYWDEQHWLEQEFGHLGYWTRKGKKK